MHWLLQGPCSAKPLEMQTSRLWTRHWLQLWLTSLAAAKLMQQGNSTADRTCGFTSGRILRVSDKIALLYRVAGPVCSAICKQGLKQRPGTVKRCTDVCLALIEQEQGEVVMVRRKSTAG